MYIYCFKTLSLLEEEKHCLVDLCVYNLHYKCPHNDSTVIKSNLVRIIDNSEYHRNGQGLADKTGLSIETIYQYRKVSKKTNISFENALKLVNALGVKIEDLME